jgi:O-antigen ligase
MAVDQRIRQVLFFLALAVPFALILGRAIADGIMGLISIGFIIHCIRYKDWSWLKTTWLRLAIIVWAYLCITACFAPFDRSGAFYQSITWFRFPLFAMAFAHWLLPENKNHKALQFSLIGLLVLVCLDTIVQYHFGRSLSGFIKPDYMGRLSGPFGKRLVVGIFLVRLAWPAIGMAFFFCGDQTAALKRFLPPILLTGLLALTVLLSGERVAFGLFCLAGLFFWIGARHLRKPLFLCGAVGIVALCAFLWLKPDLHTRFIDHSRFIAGQGTDSPYAHVVENALTAWKISPVFGLGLHNYFTACDTLHEKGGFVNAEPWQDKFVCARHPHNLYLEWLTETGLIGIALFIALVVLWAKDVLKTLHASTDDYFQQLGFAVGLVPFLWPLMTSMSFFSNWSAILFWWVLGLALSKTRGFSPGR